MVRRRLLINLHAYVKDDYRNYKDDIREFRIKRQVKVE